MNKNAFLKQIILLIDEIGHVQGGTAIDYFTYIMKDDMLDSPLQQKRGYEDYYECFETSKGN